MGLIIFYNNGFNNIILALFQLNWDNILLSNFYSF